jgi:hypothetical protein
VGNRVVTRGVDRAASPGKPAPKKKTKEEGKKEGGKKIGRETNNGVDGCGGVEKHR